MDRVRKNYNSILECTVNYLTVAYSLEEKTVKKDACSLEDHMWQDTKQVLANLRRLKSFWLSFLTIMI